MKLMVLMVLEFWSPGALEGWETYGRLPPWCLVMTPKKLSNFSNFATIQQQDFSIQVFRYTGIQDCSPNFRALGEGLAHLQPEHLNIGFYDATIIKQL